MADDCTRVQCPVCFYNGPQWLNETQHCQKCGAILKKRLPSQERDAEGTPEEANKRKYSSASAMESESGTCSKSPNGIHHWKFGMCHYCHKSEGAFLTSEAVRSDHGPNECAAGGICTFKFARCSKCGKGEGVVAGKVNTAESPAPLHGRHFSNLLKTAFARFDVDGNGVISLAELKAVLQRLPVPAGQKEFTDNDFDIFLRSMDEDHNGVIDFHEFTDWISHDGEDAHDLMLRMKAPQSNVQGPARLFYDRSTYTGTQVHSAGASATIAAATSTSIHSQPSRPGVQGVQGSPSPPCPVVHSAPCRQGECTFKFGRCTTCGRCEGILSASAADRPSSRGPGSHGTVVHSEECPLGGKCTFMFARCTRCGQAEGILSGNASKHTSGHAASARSSSATKRLSNPGVRTTASRPASKGRRSRTSSPQPKAGSPQKRTG